MGLGDLVPDDPWETPSKEQYEHVDMDLLRELSHQHLPPLRPLAAPRQYGQILESVRWVVAFEIDDRLTRRRTWAQKRVATEKEVDFDTIQSKVRRLYRKRSGNDSAQELFEADLKRIQQQYVSRRELC